MLCPLSTARVVLVALCVALYGCAAWAAMLSLFTSLLYLLLRLFPHSQVKVTDGAAAARALAALAEVQTAAPGSGSQVRLLVWAGCWWGPGRSHSDVTYRVVASCQANAHLYVVSAALMARSNASCWPTPPPSLPPAPQAASMPRTDSSSLTAAAATGPAVTFPGGASVPMPAPFAGAPAAAAAPAGSAAGSVSASRSGSTTPEPPVFGGPDFNPDEWAVPADWTPPAAAVAAAAVPAAAAKPAAAAAKLTAGKAAGEGVWAATGGGEGVCEMCRCRCTTCNLQPAAAGLPAAVNSSVA